MSDFSTVVYMLFSVILKQITSSLFFRLHLSIIKSVSWRFISYFGYNLKIDTARAIRYTELWNEKSYRRAIFCLPMFTKCMTPTLFRYSIHILLLLWIFSPVVYDFVKIWISYFERWSGSGHCWETSNPYHVVGKLENGSPHLYQYKSLLGISEQSWNCLKKSDISKPIDTHCK